ncbi:hypothetical protein KPL70_015072 [Citrus sinensis]|uniref:uncharacterized protein LOC102607035 isoform X3 n=1 Tax=Citrus sinensis TaxID=2711 RepID=UPI0021952FC3|nr:uncharacterized protein LOC102607035 isoform X3 [Citrus sinensis]KAH9688231.1 hypothetical protein KPL70_015072 [Citrus sinensis]
MAGIRWFGQTHQSVNRRSILGSIQGTVNDGNKKTNNKTATPQFLKFAVSGVTELLRLFSSFDKGVCRLDRVSYKQKDEILVSGIDDIVTILRSDYENAYFVTGIFTSEIYAEDCIFEDPTIRFRGTELYSRNLRLLVPFFEYPSIGLQNIKKGFNSDRNFLLATWKLRTYLKLPWKPLISIDGSTVYELNDELKITRHAESWNVSALEAVGQIFTPGDRN